MTRRGYICIILLAAILSLVPACTKVGVRYEPASKEIAVIPVTALASKTVPGPVDGADYPTDETFGIFAYHCNTSAGSWNDPSQTVTPYILDGEFKFREGNVWGGWNGETEDKYPYYWPTLGSLVFAGYSPYERKDEAPVSGASFSVENKTLSIRGYQVEEYSPMTEADTPYENKTQSDLMYFLPKADASGNYVGTNGDDAYGAIFHHALALVVFNVQAESSDDVNYIRLKGITLDGMASAGDLSVQMSNTPAGNVEWTLSDGASFESRSVLYNPSESGGMKLSTATRQVVEILTIPVGLHNIKITYSLIVNGDPHEETMTYQTQWEAGKKYVYNLILGTENIHLIPQITTDWATNE